MCVIFSVKMQNIVNLTAFIFDNNSSLGPAYKLIIYFNHNKKMYMYYRGQNFEADLNNSRTVYNWPNYSYGLY